MNHNLYLSPFSEQLVAIDPGSPSLSGQETVDEWLTAIKMDRYLDAFTSAGYRSMEQVAQIQLKDLVALGITLVGHQKKISTAYRRCEHDSKICPPGWGICLMVSSYSSEKVGRMNS